MDELLAKLREWLDKHGNAVVALDEFDQLDDQNKIVYDLHSLNTETDAYLGKILVANKPPSQIKLELRSNSRLGYYTIEFMPYEKDDLIEILEARAEEAFRTNAIADAAIKKIATTVEKELKTGADDCRHALYSMETCDAAADGTLGYECPELLSPHPIRKGAITRMRKADIPKSLISDRVDASEEVIEETYNKMTEGKKAGLRSKHFDEEYEGYEV